MRMDPDASHTYSNGSSTRSPGRASAHGKIANGNSLQKTETNGSHSVHTNGNSLGNGKTKLEPFFGHDREEVTRIMIQSLSDLGYHDAAQSLIQESGYELEGPTVAAFRSAVLAGEWDEAEALLFGLPDDGGVHLRQGDPSPKNGRGKAAKTVWSPQRLAKGLTLAEGADDNAMKFWLRQQKYLELLEQKDVGGALNVLRQELTPLNHDIPKLHNLTSLMMCDSADDLRIQARWDGARGQSRHHLLSELSRSISPSVMIPEHRLAVLLDRVKDSWISDCLYHNTGRSPSLYIDHICDPEDFPRKSVRVLTNHSNEVWFLKYSHDGTKLATASKDTNIYIYDTSSYDVLHCLTDHESGVCHLSWSPDDSKLISTAKISRTEPSARLWDVQNGICLREISEFTYPCTSSAWAPNGETFVTGSQDTEHALIAWNLHGDKVHQWREESMRVHDVDISSDGKLLAVLLERRIYIYDYLSKEKIHDWAFDDFKLTSISITHDCKSILISMNDNRIKLMNIETGEVQQEFDGHIQQNFIIRSSLGGAAETFVTSGSEDSKIYIWRTTGHLVETLEGHRGCVNAISWHPTNPRVFASAGDDHNVRIWSTSATAYLQR